MVFNETPIRTSNNYGINNIKLENISIPENLEEFDNVTIENLVEENKIFNEAKLINLTYGLSERLTNQVVKKANYQIKIDVNDKNKNETAINFDFEENNALVENIEIIANEQTKSTVIIKYKAKNNKEYFHNGIIKIDAKKNSNLNVIIVNLMNSSSNNFLAIENTLAEDAKVNYYIVDFGGKNSITNYYTNLSGKNSDNKVNTIYIGNENQLIDLNYIVEVYGEKANIDMNLKGAILDNAKKHFKGTIDFKKGCKKATGDENEYCTILSQTAKSIALPMLLCTEEDVEGNHSAAAGKIDSKRLFYLMSRGFDEKEAQKLIIRANFNKIIEQIENKDLKNEILNEIDKKLK